MEIKENEVIVEPKGDDKNRNKVIIKTSIIGIAANVLLAAFKAFVGIVSNSIAIILDAVNNLSDASSSTITIIGTKLSSKAPDRKHPFGYGRIEYLTSMVISVIVLYAGITSLVESIKKIISAEVPSYSTVTIIIVSVGIAAKIALGLYVKGKGKKIDSGALVNSGIDALNDSIISAATLVSIIVFLVFKVSLEAYLGAAISLYIIKSGVQMILEATSKVVGERVDAEQVNLITRIINSHEDVKGSYDLIINDYGNNKFTASVHVEVDETLTAKEIDVLTRHITLEVYTKTGIILTAIGIYSINSTDLNVVEMKKTVDNIVHEFDNILQLHGFYVEEDSKFIQFDIVVSFDEKNKEELVEKVKERVKTEYPDYNVVVFLDRDFSLS